MHIAFLTPEYPHDLSSPAGGLGTSIKNLAEALVKKDERVSVIIYGQEKDLNFEENGISFYFIKKRNYFLGGWYFYRKYLQHYINDLIEEYNIDILEAPDWTGITAFMNIKVPVLIRMNGSDAYFCHLDGRKQKAKNRFFEKSALKNADHLISVSAFTAKITREILGLKREIEVIPNSIRIDRFLPSNEETNPNQILYFGTLIRKKGVLELAEIFNQVIKKYPNAELVLIGKDVPDNIEKRSTFEVFKGKLSQEAKDKIRYLGEVPYNKVNEYITRAQVVVLPSFAEALPMTWLEAMAMEKALVTSNIGWAQEVMKDGQTGFTESPREHDLYATKIINLLQNSHLRFEWGEKPEKKLWKNFLLMW